MAALAQDARELRLVVAASVLLAAPALVFAYLPMADMPQHWAITRILLSLDDPRFGFAEFYEPAWSGTLYVLPYGVALALAPLVGFEAAMRATVFVPLLLYPLGVLAWLRALGRPPLLALLALPFVYNRAFFWGALQFEYAFGFAFLACGLLARPAPGPPARIGAAAACAGVVLSNPYGVMFVLGFGALAFVCGERRLPRRQLPALALLLLGVAVWLFVGAGAPAMDTFYFEPLAARLRDFDDEILGGYRGHWEDRLLVAFGAVWLLLSHARVPVTRRRWLALAPVERAACALALVCAVAYFALPTHTAYAKAVHFRFALLTAACLPLVAGTSAPLRRGARALLLLLATATLALAWVQLARFDREARSFEAVLARLPERPKTVALSYERNGRVMRSHPYLHFLAYAQARRGGPIAASFVGEFWQEPLRERADSPRPPSPPDLAWFPERFDLDGFGAFYDHVIVRAPDAADPAGLAARGYALLLDAPPWRLYRAPPREEE